MNTEALSMWNNWVAGVGCREWQPWQHIISRDLVPLYWWLLDFTRARPSRVHSQLFWETLYSTGTILNIPIFNWNFTTSWILEQFFNWSSDKLYFALTYDLYKLMKSTMKSSVCQSWKLDLVILEIPAYFFPHFCELVSTFFRKF